MYLNGRRVGDQLFTPGWTSYNKRLSTRPTTSRRFLQAGANAVGVQLGNGWYRGDLAWEGRRNVYGDRLGLLLQLQVTYKDGREELVLSDGQWKASTGPILMSEI
jgi:alpha-L-rhamnosidase